MCDMSPRKNTLFQPHQILKSREKTQATVRNCRHFSDHPAAESPTGQQSSQRAVPVQGSAHLRRAGDGTALDSQFIIKTQALPSGTGWLCLGSNSAGYQTY